MKKYRLYFILSGIIVITLYCRPYMTGKNTHESHFVQKESVNENSDMPVTHKKQGKLVFPDPNKPLILPAYNWPPFNLLDSSGKWKGADIEITEQVLNRMGYKVEWIELPFKRALEEMRSNKYPGMAPCVIGGGREEYILFSAPVSSIYSVLWKKKSDDFSWESYDDLKGRTIGASFYHYGSGFLEAAKEGKFVLDMVASKTPELIHFRKLALGRTDMFISELSVGLYIQHENRPQFDGIDYCPKGVGPVRPFCFAISRKYFEGRPEQLALFAETFNSELAKFSREGKRKTIFENYHMAVQMNDKGEIIISEENNK